MDFGLGNFLAWLFGGKLYYCLYCRLQFYDWRGAGKFP
jgi:hypothetical protein